MLRAVGDIKHEVVDEVAYHPGIPHKAHIEEPVLVYPDLHAIHHEDVEDIAEAKRKQTATHAQPPRFHITLHPAQPHEDGFEDNSRDAKDV